MSKPTKSLKFLSKNTKTHHAHKGGVIKKYFGKVWNLTLNTMVYAMIIGNMASAVDRHFAATSIDTKSDAQIQQLAPEEAAILLGRLSAAGNSANPINEYLPNIVRRGMNQFSAMATGYDEERARIYVNTGLDQKFLDYYKPHREKWHNWVKNAPLVENAKAHWAEMNEAERLKALRAITAKHDEFFGFENTYLTVKNVAPKETYIKACDKTVMSIFGAVFSPNKNTITINSYKDGLNWSYFEMALSTAIHENTHAHQWQLANQLGHGGIERDDPRWSQTALFLANFNGISNSFFTSGGNNINTGAYYAQPVERHSYWTQKELLKVRSDVHQSIKNSINNKLGRKLKTPESESSKSVPHANPYCD